MGMAIIIIIIIIATCLFVVVVVVVVVHLFIHKHHHHHHHHHNNSNHHLTLISNEKKIASTNCNWIGKKLIILYHFWAFSLQKCIRKKEKSTIRIIAICCGHLFLLLFRFSLFLFIPILWHHVIVYVILLDKEYSGRKWKIKTMIITTFDDWSVS